jgi:hypothetical protein
MLRWVVIALTVLTACSATGERKSATPSTVAVSTSLAPAPTPSTTSTVAVSQPGGCPASPTRGGPAADRPRYTLHISVDLANNAVDGQETVSFTPNLTTDRLVFRLWPNGPALAAAGSHLEPGPIRVDGVATSASRPDPTTVVVPIVIAAGATVTASLPWRLTLPGPVSDRVARVGDFVRLGSFFPILSWEPGVGWATEPPTTATSPAADFDLTIALPPGLSALATGVPDGHGRWLATAVPDIGVSVGNFVTATAAINVPQPVSITVGVAAGLAESPQTYLAKAERVISSYSQRFGPYPWPVYTLAITPGLTGGIEYPMAVMQGPNTIGRTTSHELGHEWFYALVSDDQARDPWLDEGLATWSEEGYEGTVATFRRIAIPPDGQGRAGAPMTYWETRHGSYYLSVYVQTAQALGTLGAPDAVDCALRLYVARFAYRIARPADLIDTLAGLFPGATVTLARFGLGP